MNIHQKRDRPDYGEHGVEVLALATVEGDLDEVLDGLHSLKCVGFLEYFCSYPEGLLIDELLKLLQVSISRSWFQLEEVVHVLCGLDAAEELKVSHGELGGHLQGVELKQVHLALLQELLGVVVGAQSLRLCIVLQVVPGRTVHTHLSVKGNE